MSDEFEKWITRTWAASQGKSDAKSGTSSTLSRTIFSTIGGKDALGAYDDAHTSTSNLLVQKTLQDQAKQAQRDRWELQRQLREEEQRQREQERREYEYRLQLEAQEKRRVKALKERIKLFSTHFREMETLATELASAIDSKDPSELDFLQASTVLVYILTLTEAEKDIEFELNVPFLSISERAAFEENCKKIYELYINQYKEDPRQIFRVACGLIYTYGQLAHEKAVWLLEHIFEAESKPDFESIDVRDYSKIENFGSEINSEPLTLKCTFATASAEKTKARISNLTDEFSKEISEKLQQILEALEKIGKESALLVVDVLKPIQNSPTKQITNTKEFDLLDKLLALDSPAISIRNLVAVMQFTPKYPAYVRYVAEMLVDEKLWIYEIFSANESNLEMFQQLLGEKYKDGDIEIRPFADQTIRFTDLDGEVAEIGNVISAKAEDLIMKDGTLLPLELLEKLYSDFTGTIGNEREGEKFADSTILSPNVVDFVEAPYLNSYADKLLHEKLNDVFVESEKHVEKLHEDTSNGYWGGVFVLVIIALVLLYFSFNLLAGCSFLLASFMVAKAQRLVKVKNLILDSIEKEKEIWLSA